MAEATQELEKQIGLMARSSDMGSPVSFQIEKGPQINLKFSSPPPEGTVFQVNEKGLYFLTEAPSSPALNERYPNSVFVKRLTPKEINEIQKENQPVVDMLDLPVTENVRKRLLLIK